jgi:hypothetical protein
MLTLWDLLKQVVAPAPPARPALPKRKPSRPATSGRKPRTPPQGVSTPATRAPARQPARTAMGERYEQITRQYLEQHGVRVRKWRSHMSGIATQVKYRDGRIAKYIESPRPRGPMSVAIFLHEIGHHAIGFNTYRPRCLEEYHAWRYAIEHMESLGLNVTDSVRRRMHNSLRYAVQKARRRGIKDIPAELHPYMQPWQGKTSGRRRRR